MCGTCAKCDGVIRRNISNLHAIKKAVAAIVHHSTIKQNLQKRHQSFPCSTCCSWKYWSDKINGRDTSKDIISIDKTVSDVIAPIFSYKDLGSDALLWKCLYFEARNFNGSLNSSIWTQYPKRIYVGNSERRETSNDQSERIEQIGHLCTLQGRKSVFVEEILLTGDFMCKIDLKDGYFAVPLSENS